MGTDQLLKLWLWKLNILVKWWLWELTNYCTGDNWFIVESGGNGNEVVIIETKYTGKLWFWELTNYWSRDDESKYIGEVVIMGTNYSD